MGRLYFNRQSGEQWIHANYLAGGEISLWSKASCSEVIFLFVSVFLTCLLLTIKH